MNFELSIIVSFLDVGPFLAEAIESVLGQTFKHWELILVDDGSRDESTAIALAFAQRYQGQIRYLEHPGHINRGISASRNLGLRHSKGDLIAFLDGDDCYLPERLQRHVEILDSMPEVDMVQSNALRWFSWEQNGIADVAGPLPSALRQVIPAPQMLVESLEQDPEAGWFPCTCSVTLRKSAIADVGMFEEGFPTLCEDWVFWQKIYASKAVYVTPDIVARYRKHLGSVLHRAADDLGSIMGPRYLAHVQYLRWLKGYLVQHGANEAILHSVRRQLWPDEVPLLRGVGLPPALRLTIRTAKRRIQEHLRFAARQTRAFARALVPSVKPARTRPGQ